MSQLLTLPAIMPPAGYGRLIQMVDSVSSLAQVTAPGYLATQQADGHVFYSTDQMFVQYNGGSGWFSLAVNGSNVVTLSALGQLYGQVGQFSLIPVSLGHAALASAGKVNIQLSTGTQQYVVNDIRVRYASAGLSGSSGDRLISISDGTTVYNSTGITAALAGTPVNTAWGGSGNPLPGSVDMATPTAAGANLFAQYIGGTTDYSAGSLLLQVEIVRVA